MTYAVYLVADGRELERAIGENVEELIRSVYRSTFFYQSIVGDFADWLESSKIGFEVIARETLACSDRLMAAYASSIEAQLKADGEFCTVDGNVILRIIGVSADE